MELGVTLFKEFEPWLAKLLKVICQEVQALEYFLAWLFFAMKFGLLRIISEISDPD